MSDAISQIGDFLNSGAGNALLKAGTAGTGIVQNLLANQQAQKKQNFVEGLISNPKKFNAYVQSFEQPLSQGLTSDISRQADAYGGERGLGSSPAIMKDVYAQALAPYLLQQQQTAQQAALSGLGIYENSPTAKGIDISSILKALSMNPQQSNVTAGVNPGATPGLSGFDLSSLLGTGGGSGPLPTPIIGSGGAGFDPTTMEGN